MFGIQLPNLLGWLPQWPLTTWVAVIIFALFVFVVLNVVFVWTFRRFVEALASHPIVAIGLLIVILMPFLFLFACLYIVAHVSDKDEDEAKALNSRKSKIRKKKYK